MSNDDTTEVQAWGEISNVCTCEPPDEVDADLWHGCGGDCWDDSLYLWDLVMATELDAPFGTPHLWLVYGLPLWDGNASGVAEVRTTRDLLDGLTVNSEWRLRWFIVNRTTLRLRLWHHDAPMGGTFFAEYRSDIGDSE